MFEELFPQYIFKAFAQLPTKKLNEIRLRLNKKIVVTLQGKSYYLCQEGLTGNADKALIADKFLIDEIVKRACENSVYAYSNQIREGFLTLRGGARVGLCGEGVCENGAVKTLKNINSLAIRVPHEVKGCSAPAMEYLFRGGFLSTLVISPPGCGKTTFIRDIIFQLSQKNYCYSVLVCDERFEIANCFNGINTLDVGEFCDIVSGVPKNYAFGNAIRAMRPDILVTDELGGEKDCDAVVSASSCGTGILASVHAKDIDDLKRKQGFERILKEKVFDRFVVLSSRNGPGTIEGVFDENLRCISYV